MVAGNEDCEDILEHESGREGAFAALGLSYVVPSVAVSYRQIRQWYCPLFEARKLTCVHVEPDRNLPCR